jgi:hypothetical protein
VTQLDILPKMGIHTIPLHWKNLYSNLFHTLTDLHSHNIFTDVTLVSDDGIQFAAHKSILSSRSPILKGLLLTHPETHPIIFMGDVHQEQLKTTLQFIYLGEVRVLTSGIGSFLEIAKELQMTEIDIINESSGEYADEFTDINVSEITNEIPDEFADNNADKIRDEANEHENEHENYTLELVMVKEECDILEQEKIDIGVPEQSHFGSSQILSAKQRSHVCSDCGKAFNCQSRLKRHHDNKHDGNTFPCYVCDHISTDSSNLKRHHLGITSSGGMTGAQMVL